MTEELQDTYQLEVARAGFSAITEYIERLRDEFTALVATFDTLADAPRTLTGHETPADIDAHTALLRCANDLTIALSHRRTLAEANGEAADIDRDIIWLVIAPHAGTSIDAVNACLREYHGRQPTTLADWDTLQPLGLGLARSDEVPNRSARHANVCYTRGMTSPDGEDYRTYGEVENHPDATNPFARPRVCRSSPMPNSDRNPRG